MSILRTIARLIAPWRTIRRLERENRRLSKILENPFLAGVTHGRETGLEVGMHGSGPQLLAGMFVGLMETQDAPNYLEITFQTPKGPMVVTVIQPGGATPHQLRQQAEQRVRKLEARLAALPDHIIARREVQS